MNTKKAVVLVLLVALLVLFAMTLAIGLRDRDSGGSSLVESLEGLKSDRFLVNRNSQNCGDDETTVTLAQATCTITVAKSGRFSAPTRAVLDVILGQKVVTELVPDSGSTQKQTLEGGDCAEAVFGRGGGTLALTCPGTTGCAIRLLQESCSLEAPV